MGYTLNERNPKALLGASDIHGGATSGFSHKQQRMLPFGGFLARAAGGSEGHHRGE